MADNKLINVVSININGLNNPIKRKRTLAYIKKLKVDVAFLQETHLTDVEHQKLKREWVGQVVASSFNSKAKGVATLINKKLPFKLQSVVLDVSGRYVLINCQIYSEMWTLNNIYVPNTQDEQFIQDSFMHLSEANENILIGGDFNCCFDPILDKTSKSIIRTKTAKKKSFLDERFEFN